ncbi:hypothetical protein CRYUN_Cryun04dG0120500 [Craigia yunnanensis]
MTDVILHIYDVTNTGSDKTNGTIVQINKIFKDGIGLGGIFHSTVQEKCSEDFDLLGLCCHIDEEHHLEATIWGIGSLYFLDGSREECMPCGLCNCYCDLRGNRLSGQIPDEIGDCSSFKSLDLSFNELYGDIPFSISKLKQLEFLELNDNHLTGHIPPELGKLTELFDLNVANNHLEGPIPDNLSSCTNLNSLNVHGNKLNGTIPPPFEKLESMTYLNLSSNNIKGSIPIELSCIGNLDTLGSIPSSIGDLEHLLKLNLKQKSFDRSHSSRIWRLENNNLSGDVMSLINCISLTILNKCFLRQFYASVSKVDYFTYRHGFITVVGTTPLQRSSEGKSFNSFRRTLHQW